MLFRITLWCVSWKNEILTEHGCETIFFDESSMKMKQPWNSMVYYCHLIAQFYSPIKALLMYINDQTRDVQGFSSRVYCPNEQDKCIWNKPLKIDDTRGRHFLVIICCESCLPCFSVGERWPVSPVRKSWLELNDESQRQQVTETKWGSCLTDCNMEIPIYMISKAVFF